MKRKLTFEDGVKQLTNVLKKPALRKAFIDEELDERYKKYEQFFVDYLSEILGGILKSSEVDDIFYILYELKIYNKGIGKIMLNLDRLKVNYYAKLSILDYLLTTAHVMDRPTYLSINEWFNQQRNFSIVKFQAMINLAVHESEKYEHNLLSILEVQVYPTFFYRVLNSLKEGYHDKKFTKSFIEEIRKLVISSYFDDRVKSELLHKMVV